MWWQVLLAVEIALTLLCAAFVAAYFVVVRAYAVHAARRLAAAALALTAGGVALLTLAVALWQRQPAVAALTMAPACLSQLLLAALVLRAELPPSERSER